MNTPPDDGRPEINSTLGLARYLHLSEWTVSRAINGHPEVKAATRKRVLQAMDEVGFRPNPVARSLSGKAMGIIGVCFGNAHSAIMIDKITLLDRFLRDHHLRALLSISQQDEESESRILADFRHLRVDGVVLIQSILKQARLQRILGATHSVYIEPNDPALLPSVTLDRGKAMKFIIDHLVELGHRTFGLLGFSQTHRVRWDGVKAALLQHRIDPDKQVQFFELDAPGWESYAEGIQLAEMALQAANKPTAYIAINDRVAAGAMQKMHDDGYRIPQDFSVVGFDNLPQGCHLRPTITTIDQQQQLLVAQTGQLLLELLGKSTGSGMPRAMHVEPRLIVRESTGPAAVLASGKRQGRGHGK